MAMSGRGPTLSSPERATSKFGQAAEHLNREFSHLITQTREMAAGTPALVEMASAPQEASTREIGGKEITVGPFNYDPFSRSIHAGAKYLREKIEPSQEDWQSFEEDHPALASPGSQIALGLLVSRNPGRGMRRAIEGGFIKKLGRSIRREGTLSADLRYPMLIKQPGGSGTKLRQIQVEVSIDPQAGVVNVDGIYGMTREGKQMPSAVRGMSDFSNQLGKDGLRAIADDVVERFPFLKTGNYDVTGVRIGGRAGMNIRGVDKPLHRFVSKEVRQTMDPQSVHRQSAFDKFMKQNMKRLRKEGRVNENPIDWRERATTTTLDEAETPSSRPGWMEDVEREMDEIFAENVPDPFAERAGAQRTTVGSPKTAPKKIKGEE